MPIAPEDQVEEKALAITLSKRGMMPKAFLL